MISVSCDNVVQESLCDNGCQNRGCPSRGGSPGVAEMSQTQLNQPERAHQGAFSLIDRPKACADYRVAHCISSILLAICWTVLYPADAHAEGNAPRATGNKGKPPSPDPSQEAPSRLGSSGESCTRTQDCAAGLKCLERVCIDPELGRDGDSCGKTADCNGHLRCIDRACRASSASTANNTGATGSPPLQSTPLPLPAQSTQPVQPVQPVATQPTNELPLAAPYPATPLAAPPQSTVTTEKRVAGSTISVGLGFGNGGDQKGGTGYGALGFIQLSRASGFSYGVPIVISHFSSSPVASTLAMSGFQIGRWAYVQALLGFGSSGKSEQQFNANGTLTPGYRSNTDAAIGLGVGLTVEFSKQFGLTAEAVVTKVSTIDSYTGGFLIGPTFFPWGTRR